MSSEEQRLIEKFGLAIYGEEPEVIICVLAALVRELCDRWDLEPEAFLAAIKSANFKVEA